MLRAGRRNGRSVGMARLVSATTTGRIPLFHFSRAALMRFDSAAMICVGFISARDESLQGKHVAAFSAEESEQTRRRSKAEMICELMLAISNGAVRPTRIMQRANLTWNALLVYLNALAANGLIRREERGSVSIYHLTEKGEAVLGSYVALKEALGPLKLESVNTRTFVETMKAPVTPAPPGREREALVAELQSLGYDFRPAVVKGKSGVDHEFGVVARDPAGIVHAYVFADRPDEKLILGLFVRQLDTGIKVHVAYRDDPTIAAVERAREYGLELTRLGPQSSPRQVLPETRGATTSSPSSTGNRPRSSSRS